jgi:hypothetical protein
VDRSGSETVGSLRRATLASNNAGLANSTSNSCNVSGCNQASVRTKSTINRYVQDHQDEKSPLE